MYLKQFHNLLLCAERSNYPLLRFYFINPRNLVFKFVRQTASTERSPIISDSHHLMNQKDLYAVYFHKYLLEKKEKYDICSIEDLNSEEETKVSLKLLNDFVNNAKETLEDQEIPQELQTNIEREIHEYNLNEICKYIVLISKLSFASATKLSEYLDSSTRNKTFTEKDALKILYIMTTYVKKNLYSKLLWKTLHKLFNHVKRLTPQQTVLFFFSLKKLDSISMRNIKFNLIEYLVKTVPLLNSDELGIVARGFQKCSIKLSDGKLIEAVINKTITEKQNFNDLPLSMILKMIAENLKLENLKDAYNLQKEFIPVIPTLRHSTILTLAGVGSSLSSVNSSFWEVILKYFKENFDTCTTLNVIRLVQLATIFGHYDNELFQKAIEKVEAETDLLPNFLILFLNNLVLHQLYPEKLLHKVLSKDFRLAFEKIFKFKSKYKYAFLHFCAELELPTNNFTFMNETEKRNYYKALIYTKFEHRKKNFSYFATLQIQEIILNEYGENSVIKMFCIPYADAGLVMRFDRSLKAQSIPKEFKQFDKHCAREALKDDHLWIFIRVLSKYEYSVANNELTIETKILRRHLKLLGYTPIFITGNDWYELLQKGTTRESVLDAIQKNLQNTVSDIHNK